MSVKVETALAIEEKLFEEMDNQDAGFVLDYEIIPAGEFNGLQHSGVHVRVIKLDENHYSFSQQSDSMDNDPAIGSLEEISEHINECQELANEVASYEG